MHMSVYIIPLAIICDGLKLQDIFDMLVNHSWLHFQICQHNSHETTE